jgi:putative ABC transport system ATP-binding protein
MKSRTPVIETHDLVKTYEDGRVRALDGVTVKIFAGEFVAVVGPSGCGKSTLLHMIGALDKPDSGSILVNGEDLAKERDLDKHRATEVGLVFQLDNLLPTLSASDNVQVPMLETTRSVRERRARAMELLRLVALDDRAKNRPTELSGGERQRVAIARALANEPGILLMDEPTGRLDQSTSKRVLELVRRLNKERGLTIVLVTHDPAVASRADRIIQMVDGKIVSAAADDVANRPPMTGIVDGLAV